MQNAGGKLPSGYHEIQREHPPPPNASEDSDIMQLSMILSSISMDPDVSGQLDESGIERVPMADPGLDVRGASVSCFVFRLTIFWLSA